MSKIICDICGTSYPETSENCPICGCSRDAAADFLGEEFIAEEVSEDVKAKSRHFSKKKEIFDFDEVNSPVLDEPIDENNPYAEEEEEYEEHKGHNVLIVIILTVLIFALLAAAGFIFVRYFLPNMKDEEAEVPTTETTVAVETEAPVTEATIPCQMLILESGTAELSKEGQMFLLHVKPSPEDTTDKIVYTSGDETVAIVTEDGRISAVAEGETVIYISCGNVQTTCPVVVSFVEETVPVTEETVPEETAPVETVAEESTPAIRTDVTLKLKQTDIGLGVYYQYQLVLDCDLQPNEVEWRSEHPHIVKVDENGLIEALKYGTTAIIAKYGDQEVSCIVRCH